MNSVATRLLLLALCIVCLGLVVRYFTLMRFLHEELATAIESQQLTLSSYIAHNINDNAINKQVTLNRIASSLPPSLLRKPTQLRYWLEQQNKDQTSRAEDFLVVDLAGQPIAAFPATTKWKRLTPDIRALIQAKLSGHLGAGRLLMNQQDNAPLYLMAAPIKGQSNRALGALISISKLADTGLLDALLAAQPSKALGGFMLFAPQDKLSFAISPSGLTLVPLLTHGINPLQDLAMARVSGSEIVTDAKGEERVVAMASIASTGWVMVAHLPGRVAFSAVTRAQHFFIKNAILAVVVFTLLTSLGLYWVFRSLFLAARHADRMTRGELPLEPLPTLRNDEVGHLIAAFNRLLDKLHLHQAELARLAHHDTLTGLPNRVLLSDRLQQVLAQAQRQQTKVGLLFLDLDGFKQINDTLGHEAGDEALRQIAQRLALIVRQADTLARIGGDEFVLLLSNLKDDAEQAVHTVALKCIAALSTPIFISGQACSVGVSIGIALGDKDSSSDRLLQAADHAMYQAKKTGRGGYAIYQYPPAINDTQST